MPKPQNYDSTGETLEHIKNVQDQITWIVFYLLQRGTKHDRSKLDPEEKPIFDKMTPLLKTLEYGSEEYKESLKQLGPALQHHYEANSHHPEHFPNGIAGMNLLDLVEMFCDWKAASLRTKNGNFEKSVKLAIERFKIEPQLASILRNSIGILI